MESGQRPTAVISGDPYWGHRPVNDPSWLPEPALAHTPTSWDLALLRAYQVIQNYTTPSGQLIWVDSDPDVYWDVKKSHSYSEKALADYREREGDQPQGVSLYATPVFDEDEEAPTLSDWIERLMDEESDVPDREDRGRPPTAEELAALQKARETE